MQKEQLTTEQLSYINKPTLAGLLGPMYAIATGLYKQFWLFFIPFYNIYLFFKLIIKGRKMAWEKSEMNYDGFLRQQKELSRIAKILFGLFIVMFFIQIIAFAIPLSSGGSIFGKDVAVNFSQKIFTDGQISDLISTDFILDQNFIDFEKDTRGEYKNSSFYGFSRENDRSKIEGTAKFTNISMPVCIDLIKFGEEWKVSDFSSECKE